MTAATVPSHSRSGPLSPTTLFAAVFCGALVLALGLRLPGFIHHDTTEVVMWGHSGWALGFWKHPPFLPWVSRLWFSVLPLNPWTIALLTALNMTVCAWAVWRIALLAGADDAAATGILAVLLLASLPYASGMAVKLNHNSALISLWPLTTLAFLRALDRPTIGRGILFGIAAAAAMLTKYYSGLLLVACLVASFARPARAIAFYRSPAPYAAVVAFALAIAPHVWWLIDHRASTLAYAFSPPAGGAIVEVKRGGAMALSFAIQTPLILAPMAVVALLFRRTADDRSSGIPHRFERELLILAILPYALTVILTAGFHLRGAIAWAMPVSVCLPALIAARIGATDKPRLRTAGWIAGFIAAIVAVGGQIGMRTALAHGADGIAEPRPAIAKAITTWWHTAVGGPLPLVAGDQRLASAAIVFSADHPQAWPSLSNLQAPWVDEASASATGYVALCRPSDTDCGARVEKHANGRQRKCLLKRRVTYLGAAGPWFEANAYLVPPAAAGAGTNLTCPFE